MIHWTPISQLPDELRDGRQLLFTLARRFRFGDNPLYSVAWWSSKIRRWQETDEVLWSADDFTHYSEINSPATGAAADSTPPVQS
jgi:hypothetical protein